MEEEEVSSPYTVQHKAERATLLHIVEQADHANKEAKHAWLREREETRTQHALIEETLTSRLHQLTQENALLKEELRRLREVSVPPDAQLELLQELDQAIASKETDHQQELLRLKRQLKHLRTLAENAQRVKDFESAQLRLQLEQSQAETSEFRRVLEQLRVKCQRANTELASKAAELERTKNLYEGKFQVLLKQKVETMSAPKPVETVKPPKTSASEGTLKRTCREQELEIGKLTVQINRLTHTLETTVQDKDYEIQSLQRNIKELVSQSESRETESASQIEAITGRLQALQEKHLKREAQLLKHAAESTQALSKYQSALAEQFPAVRAEALAEATGASALLLEPRGISIVQPSYCERLSITQALTSFQALKNTLSNQAFVKEELEYSAKIRALEQQATERERQLLQQIQDLDTEIGQLQEECTGKEELVATVNFLETEQVQVKKELTLAKEHLKLYARSVKELEQVIQERQMNGEAFTENDTVQALQLEVKRLTASLKVAEDSNAEQVTALMEQLTLKQQRGSPQKASKHRKDVEDILAWQGRQSVLTKTIRQLEKTNQALAEQAATWKQITGLESHLASEELNLLRREVKQRDNAIETQQQEFTQAVAQVEEARSRLNSVVTQYQTAVNAVTSAYTLLTQDRARLQELLVIIPPEELHSLTESTTEEMLLVNKKEYIKLNEQLIKERQEFQQTVQTLEAQLQADTQLFRNRETALKQYIDKQIEALAQDEHPQRILSKRELQHSIDVEGLKSQLRGLLSMLTDENQQRVARTILSSLGTLHTQTNASQQLLEQDSDTLKRKMRQLQTECDSLRSQRDSLLKTFSNLKSLSKSDRELVKRLVTQLSHNN